jgi:hypothetical protein
MSNIPQEMQKLSDLIFENAESLTDAAYKDILDTLRDCTRIVAMPAASADAAAKLRKLRAEGRVVPGGMIFSCKAEQLTNAYLEKKCAVLQKCIEEYGVPLPPPPPPVYARVTGAANTERNNP